MPAPRAAAAPPCIVACAPSRRQPALHAVAMAARRLLHAQMPPALHAPVPSVASPTPGVCGRHQPIRKARQLRERHEKDSSGEAARGTHLRWMAASISSADLPLAQMMKMWPNRCSYRAFHPASACAGHGSQAAGLGSAALAARSCDSKHSAHKHALSTAMHSRAAAPAARPRARPLPPPARRGSCRQRRRRTSFASPPGRQSWGGRQEPPASPGWASVGAPSRREEWAGGERETANEVPPPPPTWCHHTSRAASISASRLL